MKIVGKSKVSKLTPKPGVVYPFIRLPQEYQDLIGNTVSIYEAEHEGTRAFLLVPCDNTTIPVKVIQPSDTKDIEKRVSELETLIKEISGKINSKEVKINPENKIRDTPDQIRTGVAGSKVLHD